MTPLSGSASRLGVRPSVVKPGRGSSPSASGHGSARGERDAQHVPERHPGRPPVERVGGRGVEEDGVGAEGGGVAEDGADVLVVVDALEDDDRPQRSA